MNMSYVAMENTYAELAQCVEILEKKGVAGLSDSEKKYAEKLSSLCERFREVYAE